MLKKYFAVFLSLTAVVSIFLAGCGKDISSESASVNSVESTGKSFYLASAEGESLIDKLEGLPVEYFREDPGKAFSEQEVTETDEPFLVTDFGPEGELPSDMKYPSVYVLFSQPVVPLKMLGKPSSESEIMKIEPELKGVFRWYGTRLLSFESASESLPQRVYTVKIAENLKSLGGKLLNGRKSFSFHTEYLSMESAVPGRGAVFEENEVPVDEASRITVTFNYPVNLETVSDYLAVESGGRNYEFSISRPEDPSGKMTPRQAERIAVLELNSVPEENSEIVVTLKKGARSEAHFIGTPEKESIGFRTVSPFRFEESSARSYAFPGSDRADSNPVFLEFTHPVKRDGLADHISVYPEMTISEDNIAVWRNIVKVSNLPVEYDTSYTFILDSEISDIYGRFLGKDVTVDVDIPDAASYYWFPNTGTRILEAAFDPKIVFEYQNIFDGEWKVDSISDPYSSFRAAELGPYDFSGAPENMRHFELLDLSPWLSSRGTGWVGMSWNFEERDKNGERPSWGQRNLQLQVTDLAVTTRYGYNRVVVLVSSLSTGKVVRGADVSLMRDRQVVMSQPSDESGLAVFELDDGEYTRLFADSASRWKDHLRLRVETSDDAVEFVPNSSHNVWHMGIYNVENPFNIQNSEMETFLFTDRGLYRPGETVTFRGIDRDLTLGEYTAFTGSYNVSLKEPSYRGKVLDSVSGFASESGGFHGSFNLPGDMSPGYYRLVYGRDGQTWQILFQVANFERLSFEVNLEKPDLVLYPDMEVRYSASARYLSGGSLSGGSYDYSWTKTPSYFRPEGDKWKGWTFGPGGWDQRYVLSSGSGTLGPDGNASLSQTPSPEGVEGLPYDYTLELRVQDEGRAEVAKRLSAKVHPASFYLGLKLAGTGWSGFVSKGDAAEIEYAVIDPEGNPFRFPDSGIRMELIRKVWKQVNQQGIGGRINTQYEQVEELESESRLSADSGGVFEITPAKSGMYTVRLTAEDSRGRKAVTNLLFYSTGGDWIRWGRDDTQDINLETDREVYKPGETAKLLIKSPLPEGTYLITVEREGIFEEQVVELKGGAQVIGIPVTDNYVPVVYVAVSSYSVRSGKPDNSYFEPDLDKPKGYFGIVPVRIDTSSRTFDIKVETDKSSYRPGEEVEMKISSSSGGRPLAAAEITLMAVDRGVLDLIDYHVPDPVAFFYSPGKFPLGTKGADSRSLLIDPVTYEVKDLQGGGSEDGKIEERKDFNPTAVFEPYIMTDDKGEAVVRFTLPDNLTTYRVTAIGVKNNSFGISESELFARNPVNVRSVMPSLLRQRDTVLSGVTLTNLSDSSVDVSVTAESDILSISGEAEKNIVLEPGSTVLADFPMTAASAGEGEVVFKIRSGSLNEDLHSEVEIIKPYVTETFTTAGRLGDSVSGRTSAEEQLIIPSSAEDGIGSFSIVLSPGFLGELKSASDYLAEYPFNCFEQRSSKAVSRIITEDSDAGEYVSAQLSLMAKYQNRDGGIPFWPESGYRSSYYVSLRAAHLMFLAEEAGISASPLPDLKKLLDYLNTPSEYAEKSDYLMTFRFYVSALHGRSILAASEFDDRSSDLELVSRAFLGLAYDAAGNRKKAEDYLDLVKKYIRPGTRTLDITRPAVKESFYASSNETLSLILMLMSRLEPEGEMTMRALNTLSFSKRNGYWGNTADTAWAMLALAGTADKTVPDYKASVSAGADILAAASFESSSRQEVSKVYKFSDSPLSDMERDVPVGLNIEKNGTGTLFYTASLKYALPSELIDVRDEGIGVFTEIRDMNGNMIDPERITVGQTYRQKVFLSSTRDRHYLSVRVPVPSGARVLDASFVTTALHSEREQEESDYSYWYNPPRKEIYDNEVIYFFDYFSKGKQEVEFYFRAVRPGIFPTPPVTAECMYEPEVFGRTEGRLVVIEEN